MIMEPGGKHGKFLIQICLISPEDVCVCKCILCLYPIMYHFVVYACYVNGKRTSWSLTCCYQLLSEGGRTLLENYCGKTSPSASWSIDLEL